MTTGDGDVTVTGTDQKQIDARVTATGYKIGPNDVQVIESQSGNSVSIEVKVPHWNFSLFSGSHKSLRVELSVPRELDLDVRTGDGNVSAQGVSGKIQFDTGDGNVTAGDIQGDIRIHTGDGRIEGHNFDGSLNADTGDGNMRIDGRFDSLALKTGDGSIEAQVGNGSKVATGWNVHSGDGHITLRLPGDLNATLDAHTGDGNITLDLPDNGFRLAEPFRCAWQAECGRQDAGDQFGRRVHSHRKALETGRQVRAKVYLLRPSAGALLQARPPSYLTRVVRLGSDLFTGKSKALGIETELHRKRRSRPAAIRFAKLAALPHH